MRGKLSLVLCLLSLLLILATWPLSAQRNNKDNAERPPHGQDQLPGPALSPTEAIKKMKVPDGFSVELVVSEPDLVNPVSMCFDERGRIWVTESLEYPRRNPGPGRDRIKIFESTKGDGNYDKVTVFAEGLNIPSGIAVGHGGVWVANSPDILFYKIGTDGKAAGKPEVVVTGFGRDDTHELPNSLTWGPDGWLYGLNGVFNRSVVKQGNKTFDFTCALFRIHPRTREFQLFCEGTSNPWGVAIDGEGSFFVSACVIDHLWHLAETGYYHRQGGPYPPFTWKIDSIVQHRHQKAAYCGLVWFDSEAYPLEYRGKLFMGNIHGSCLNSDELSRDGSTYFGKLCPDFLTANDAWFMPVAQKIGPDGCLYVLDWYDRYHCYQDANRDPNGIDRERGRLYRIRHKNTPASAPFDLTLESDEQLIKRLGDSNVFCRELAQRLLVERDLARKSPILAAKLQQIALNPDAPRKQRLHALWARSTIAPASPALLEKLLALPDPTFRAWAVRIAGNDHKAEPSVREKISKLVEDPSPDVLLQVAIASRKIEGMDAIGTLLAVLNRCGEDKLIPHIVWQNLHPLLEDQSDAFLRIVERTDLNQAKNLASLMPRIVERVLARKKADATLVEKLIAALIDSHSQDAARQTLTALANKIQTGEVNDQYAKALSILVIPQLTKIQKGDFEARLRFEATLLAATFKDPAALDEVRRFFASSATMGPRRLRALEALVSARDPKIVDVAGEVLGDANTSKLLRAQILAALGRLEDPRVADAVLWVYAKLELDLRPAAIDLLTQRPTWGKQLLKAMEAKNVPPVVLSVNQVRKLLANKDQEIAELIKKQWGTLRDDRNPEREKVVKEMKDFLTHSKGDPTKGFKVFETVCAKCHKIHGEGQDVGPDITNNGRSTFDQLLSNVFDPSLVIGAAYQATTVTTVRGRAISGLLVEDSPARIVLKLEGGKLETIPREQIDEVNISKVSLMPEGLEKQLKPQELADLFAFLCLDKPPSDATARKIPGAP